MLTNFLGLSFKERCLYQISYKSSHNLITFMWYTYIFGVHYNIKYIYNLWHILGMPSTHFAYIVSALSMFGK